MARDTLLSMLPVDLSAGLFDHARPVHLDPGQTLFLSGDPGDGCYRVDDGLVKVHVISPSGGDRLGQRNPRVEAILREPCRL
jgi:CRP/FNR family cyclic AMP-dependent transcriptional regulator